MLSCYRCHETWEYKGRPAYNETCPNCSAYLHVCLNCRYYDEYSHNKCKSPTTEWIADRESVNFCDEFEAKGASEGVRNRPSKGGENKELWEKLWKKTSN